MTEAARLIEEWRSDKWEGDVLELLARYGRLVQEAAAREIMDKGQYNVVGLARIIREMRLP
jgi:hypothetical protein